MKFLGGSKPYLLLFIGRFYYRLAFLALTLVLSSVWERADFGFYASKMGTWILIDTIIISGMGKSLPKLLTNYKRLREIIIREAILIAILGSLIIVAIISAVGLLLSHTVDVGFDMLDIIVIVSLLVYSISTVMQCILRVMGNVSYDYAISFILGSLILGFAGFSFFVEMAPATNVAIRTLFFIPVNVVAARTILKLYPIKRKYGRKLHKTISRRIIKETAVMGFNGVVMDANVSVINIIFRFSGLFGAAADFNLVLAILGPFIAFFRYLLFILIPNILEIARKGGRHFMNNHSMKVLLCICLITVVSVGTALIIASAGREPIIIFILFVCRLPLLFIFETLLVYFEATMNKNLIFTAKVCVVGFIVCAVSAILFIPRFEATGSIFALIATDIVTIAIFLNSFYRSRSEKISILQED